MAAKKKAEAEFRFELKGRILEIDSEEFTFGEVEWIEDYLGTALARVDFMSIKAQWAVAYIAYKRKKPETAFDDLREWKLTSLKVGDSVKRPTQAAAKEPDGSGEAGLAEVYGVMPWDMSRLRPSEYEEMVEILNARARAAEKQRRELEARH